MCDMHGITNEQAVAILNSMRTDTGNVSFGYTELEKNMALASAVRLLPSHEKFMNFQWEVRKKLEEYKKQQEGNGILSDEEKWLAIKIIEKCLKILDNCIIDAEGLKAQDVVNLNDTDDEK